MEPLTARELFEETYERLHSRNRGVRIQLPMDKMDFASLGGHQIAYSDISFVNFGGRDYAISSGVMVEQGGEDGFDCDIAAMPLSWKNKDPIDCQSRFATMMHDSCFALSFLVASQKGEFDRSSGPYYLEMSYALRSLSSVVATTGGARPRLFKPKAIDWLANAVEKAMSDVPETAGRIFARKQF